MSTLSTLTAICSIIAITHASTTYRGDIVSRMISHVERGEENHWSDSIYCDEGHYATGAFLNLQVNRRSSADDKGAVSFKLLCDNAQVISTNNNYNWDNSAWVSIVCRSDQVIKGYSTRTEQVRGNNGDDFGMTGFRMYCTDNREDQIDVFPDKGDWTPEPMQCPTGSAVCGFRQKVQPQCGNGCDDKGLYQLDIACCANTKAYENAVGYWLPVRHGNVDYLQPYEITVGVTEHTESSWSSTEYNALEHTLKAELKFSYSGVGGSVSYQLKTSSSQTVTENALNSVTREVETQDSISCPDDGNTYLGMFRFQTDVDETGANQNTLPFQVLSAHWRCSLSGFPPKCPPYYCNELDDCQTCIDDPFED